MVLHSSLSSFVASTRLIRSGVGAIDSPDQSRQGFEQYDTFEVLEKVFHSTFFISRVLLTLGGGEYTDFHLFDTFEST